MLDRVLSNWPLKLLAVALAFFIWVSITGENRVVQDFSLPLEIELSDETVLVSQTPNTVTVRLRGPESLMRRLDPVPMGLQVDLGDAAPGDHDVQFTSADLVNVPRGAEVEFIDPARISLSLEQRLRRELDVEVNFLGQPPAGFTFYGADVLPRSILVEGPVSEVEPLEVVRTNPIRLDRRTEPFEARAAAVPEGAHVRVIDPRPLEVRVDVDAAPVERRFDEIPVQLDVGGVGQVTTEAVTVTLSGPPSAVDRVRPEQIRVLAGVGEAEAGAGPLDVDLRVEFTGIPARELARITVKSLSHRRVTVRLAGGS